MIVQTNSMRRRLLDSDSTLGERIRVIPSGYRTPAPAPTIRPEKRAMVDSAGRPRVIYVSHPSEQKNYQRLLEAIPKSARRSRRRSSS